MIRALPALLLLAACSREAPDPPPPFAAVADEVSAERIEASIRALAAFHTRHTASAEIREARRWIVGELERIDGLAVSEHVFASAGTRRLAAGVEIANVAAVLEGTDPAARERRYVVSGHYDSRASDVMDAAARAPGANDDASGVAVVLELARVFAKHPPEATLVFLCVAGEEQGLLGARRFAREARERGDRIEAMLTNDIVGNTRRPDGGRERGYVRVFSEGLPAAGNPMDVRLRRTLGAESDSASRQLARFVQEQTALHFEDFSARMVFRPDRFLRGGDHLAFNEAGYAAVRFTEPFEDYDRQHQDVTKTRGDVPDFVDFAYVAQVARTNAVVLAALANAPAPPSARIHAHALENVTTLSWETGPEPDLSHYEVVWRDTTAPDWEHARIVEKGAERTIATLPLSKDDWHFGVRAIDQDGHKSPVAYPTLQR